MHLIISFQMKN